MNSCRWLNEGKENNYLVYEIWKEIHETPDADILIQWMLSHQGIPGNTEADELAVAGCLIEHTRYH